MAFAEVAAMFLDCHTFVLLVYSLRASRFLAGAINQLLLTGSCRSGTAAC